MKKKTISLIVAAIAIAGGTSCAFAHHGGGCHGAHHNAYYNNNYNQQSQEQYNEQYNGCESNCWHYGPHINDCPYYEQGEHCWF